MDFLAMISLLFKEIHPYGNNQLAEFIYFIFTLMDVEWFRFILFFFLLSLYLSYF